MGRVLLHVLSLFLAMHLRGLTVEVIDEPVDLAAVFSVTGFPHGLCGSFVGQADWHLNSDFWRTQLCVQIHMSI